jgi:putative ABC transport system permease protein
MGTLLQDLKYGLRQFRRKPGFAAVAVITLALGIGVNTGIFSLAETVLFPRFVGAQPSQLAAIYTSGESQSGYSSSSYPDYVYYREHSRAFSGIAAFVRVEAAWTHDNTTELPWGEIVSSNYFDVLGVRPLHGRFFVSAEGASAGPAPVAVVSYRFWRAHMGSSLDAPGQTLTLNGQPFAVIGVAPEGFEGVQLNWGGQPDFWVPMSAQGSFLHEPDLLAKPQARFCLMVGRLRSGVTLGNAGSEVRLMAKQLEGLYPEADAGRTAIVLPFSQGRIWPTWRVKIISTLWLIELFAGLVLLVACADVANLLLARGVSRQKEISVRLALGAGRLRVVRQIFAESLIVSLAGAGVGLVLARWLVRWVTTFRQLFTVHLSGPPAPLDARVLGIAAGLAILTAMISGLFPAFRASRLDLNTSLKETGAKSSPGARHHRLRSLLTVAEIAIAFIGLAGAAMLLRTLWKLDSADLGLNPHHVLSASTEVYTRPYTSEEGTRFYSELLDRVRGLAGVRSAALAYDSPLTIMHLWKSVQMPGSEGQNPEAWETVEGNTVSPGYFETLGIALLRGRDFRPQDDAQAPPVVIINQTMATTFWPHENPLGRRLRIKGAKGDAEVIGVVADVKQHKIWQANEAMVYQPFSQAFAHSYHLLVRTHGDPMDVVPAVRQQLSNLDPQVPVYGAQTLEQVEADSMSEPRMTASLVSLFGGLVLFLAVAGIYAVIAFWVSERVHEIGIRMALGAEKNDVLRMVVGQGIKLALIGVAIGIAGALALTRFLSSLLYGVKPTDPVTFVAVSLILVAVALAACYIPARRAAKVDPMVALRYE